MRVRQQGLISAAAACAVWAMLPHVACAQYNAPSGAFAAPATYYNAATAIDGSTLRNQLHTIVLTGFTSIAYDGLKDTIPVYDRDPANPNNVLLVYSGYSVQGPWSVNGTIWNREHVWCDSYGLLGSGKDYSDCFNLRPADPSVNGDRNNEYYDDVPVANRMVGHPDAPECYENNLIGDQANNQMWEPRPVEKGDLARGLFYMDLRYDGTESNTMDLQLTDNVNLIAANSPYMGKLSTLLKWHYQDGINEEERRRNDVIYDQFQHNRNPFVDHPEYVWAIFGGGSNNSKIYLGTQTPSGATTASVNLRVIKDAAWGTSSVTLNKAGIHPTTFDVTTSGAATSANAGVGQTLDYNTVARAIQVSLNSSTAALGSVTGTVTIDNTDITTGGTGLGSNDGNDTINITGTVVDHAQPSFVADASATAQSIDFGYVPGGFATRTANFSVNNNAVAAGAALTAGLDVDGVTQSGSSSLSTTVTASNPATPLAASASRVYIASFAPGSTEGLSSATHTIATSDENIPGATARANLVLTTTGRTTNGNFPVTGNLFLFGGETFNTTNFNIADGATVTKLGPGVLNVNGAQTHGAAAVFNVTQGPVNFLTDANSTAAAGLKVSATSSPVTFQSKQHLRGLELHGTANATVTPNGDHALVVGSLAIDPTARLDVKDNDLIVRNSVAGSSTGGVYDGAQGQVQRGYNFGAWDQSGIVTTTPDAAGGLTTIAVARAADVLGIDLADQTTWNGETVTGADVLAMYTYAGDANLDGTIDGGDYGIIDNFVQIPTADGYFNGDFNYDSVIDGGDYGIIDNNIQSQGAPLGSSGALASASSIGGVVTAVPEPAACAFAFLAAARPLLARSRRRHRKT